MSNFNLVGHQKCYVVKFFCELYKLQDVSNSHICKIVWKDHAISNFWNFWFFIGHASNAGSLLHLVEFMQCVQLFFFTSTIFYFRIFMYIFRELLWQIATSNFIFSLHIRNLLLFILQIYWLWRCIKCCFIAYQNKRGDKCN